MPLPHFSKLGITPPKFLSLSHSLTLPLRVWNKENGFVKGLKMASVLLLPLTLPPSLIQLSADEPANVYMSTSLILMTKNLRKSLF